MIPGDTFAHFTIESLLGQGGMGSVYRCTNALGLKCVLKVLDPGLAADRRIRERFVREGRIQYTLRHPNIVRVTDIIEHDGVPALVMDYMDGMDMADRLASGALPTSEAVAISKAVLSALGAAHAEGFIHRDLKPANIFMERTASGDEPRVMDFGIAKMTEVAGLTQDREFMGTPHYSSPEQIQQHQRRRRQI